MKIVFWGTPEFCIPIFEAIIRSSHQIICVVTQPDRKRGRGKKLSFSPIKKVALEENIPCLTPENIRNDISSQQSLLDFNADIYIVVAFGQILPKRVLEFPKYGCWNIHASLLPELRGAAPIQWSLINGKKETGVGIMKMEEGLDTGPILLEKKIKIGLIENANYINNKLSKLSSSLIIEALDLIQQLKNSSKEIDDLILTNQDDLKRRKSYARLLHKEDYLINWQESSIKIHQKVLGLYPNAYSFINNKRIKLTQTIPIDQSYINLMETETRKYLGIKYKNFIPGQIICFIQGIGIIVKAKNSLLLIKGAKIEGKKELFGDSLIQNLCSKNNIKELVFNNN